MVDIAKGNNAVVFRAPTDTLLVSKFDPAVAMRLPGKVAVGKGNVFVLMRLPGKPVVSKANMCVVMREPAAANRRMSLM
jgi:hypothetical protein